MLNCNDLDIIINDHYIFLNSKDYLLLINGELQFYKFNVNWDKLIFSIKLKDIENFNYIYS